MKYLNYSVLFVRNVTDIDDKIIIKSQEKKISYRELGNSVWNEFVSAHENLNCLVPDIEPRATAYIPEIIKYETAVNIGNYSASFYDVSLISVFKNEDDFWKYTKYPIHDEVVDFIKSVQESEQIVDYIKN